MRQAFLPSWTHFTGLASLSSVLLLLPILLPGLSINPVFWFFIPIPMRVCALPYIHGTAEGPPERMMRVFQGFCGTPVSNISWVGTDVGRPKTERGWLSLACNRNCKISASFIFKHSPHPQGSVMHFFLFKNDVMKMRFCSIGDIIHANFML